MSAQPAEREDPLDPQGILDQLPADEREYFLGQYRDAVENAFDPADWKQLRRVLRLWRFHACRALAIITATVSASCSLGLNWMNSVPASAAGTCPGGM